MRDDRGLSERSAVIGGSCDRWPSGADSGAD